uniref:Uncharacterized protein n=1 Tax=Salmonella phage vB_SEnST11_KE23 TaxID=3161174 RepID=A0AAU8GIP9_9CAUD
MNRCRENNVDNLQTVINNYHIRPGTVPRSTLKR